MVKFRKKDYIPIQEQIESINRWKALENLAKKAGFDDDAFVYTEFSLMPFFELIVEECAKVAEEQSNAYTNEHKESIGCHNAASAIRKFGKTIGNKNE
jgi:hypothetical protein